MAHTYSPDAPTEAPADPALRPVAYWLLICCAFIYVMALLGAITRLTESGLSMVEWRPLLDLIPPHTPEQWQRAYDLYRTSPEYSAIHLGMNVEEFKHIYFWEWLHRLWGQLIESIFLLPFLWFFIKDRLPRPLIWRLLAIFALGGLQGIVGWLMVQSGLFTTPHVSHYRLAAHLALALTLYGVTLTTALRLLGFSGARKNLVPLAPSLAWHARAGLLLLGITIVWGAFVAGLHAGLAYNTFPLMDGQIVPVDQLETLSPWWLNGLENTAGVQFIHRLLAITTFCVLASLAARLIGYRTPSLVARRAGYWLLFAVSLQVTLGVSTLLLQVPVWLGTLHQAGAIFVLTILLIVRAVIM